MSGFDDRILPGYTGFRSRVVMVGDLPVGGDHPVRIQSMTNTLTSDTAATVGQVKSLVEAGCELVRITAQNPAEARQLARIKDELRALGIQVPLCADIHFLPEAAEIAARIVEKVRINPGNFAEMKWGHSPLTDREFQEARDRVTGKLHGLLRICMRHNTALRIGVNHGSLSGRMTDRYGDTPAGMVESAMEFARICRDFGFHQLLISMKSSNIRIAIQATRLLVARMMAEGMDYPLHLGVTEAGDGEDGRIKSAAGIGTLLSEGLGDTIRVSLTEDPVMEIPFARKLADAFREGRQRLGPVSERPAMHPYHFGRRSSFHAGPAGGGQPPLVISSQPHSGSDDNRPDLVCLDEKFYRSRPGLDAKKPVISGDFCIYQPGFPNLDQDHSQVLVTDSTSFTGLQHYREFFSELVKRNIQTPVFIRKDYTTISEEDLLIRSTLDLAPLLTDGLADGIWIEAPGIDPPAVHRLAFGILQATGVRITRTEYIACPSCGRTKFNIQEVLAKVKEATREFKGLKIAVMGCIVNGPGEMSDADFGYVGAGPGKVHLYRNKQLVKKNIPEEQAVAELLVLIEETTH